MHQVSKGIKLLRLAISIFLPVAIYAIVLNVAVLREIGWMVRHGSITVFVFATILLLYPAYRLSGRVGTAIALSLTLILFAIPLLGVWSDGVYGTAFFDLFPFNDPNMYYSDAKRLLEGMPFTWGSQRRPIFAGVFATLLGLLQQDLRVTTAVVTLIVAVSCFLAAREVQRNYGVAAGVLTIVVLSLFYRLYTGNVVTESLGLALGAISFALLLRGARQSQRNTYLLGLLTLTLALNVRAGAFFILPALLLWGAWLFRGKTRFSWNFALRGFSAVLVGFIINSLVSKIICTPTYGTIPFGNFSYTLYGLIVGGDWRQVLVDHPELTTAGASDRKIYELVFKAFLANPFGLVTGSIRALTIFMFSDYLFSFVLNSTINIILRVLSFVGLFACYWKRREAEYSLIIVATLGILVSVPFLPPWDSAAMRVYAATLPFTCVLPALGLAFLARNLRWYDLVKVPNYNHSPQILWISGVALSVLCFLGPIATRWLSATPQAAINVPCKPGSDSVVFRFDPSSSINLVSDNSGIPTYLPNIRLSDFNKGLTFVYNPQGDLPASPRPLLAQKFSHLAPSTTLINTLNLNNVSYQTLLIVDSSMVPKARGVFGACGRIDSDVQNPSFLLFYADSIKRDRGWPRITAGATSVEKGWSVSNLIDGTDATWGSTGADGDIVFYVTSARAYKAKSLQIEVFATSNGSHIRDLSVVGTSDKIDGRERWNIIKSRLSSRDAFTEKITVPSLPDKTVVTIEVDVNDPKWQEYKTIGFAGFSKSKSYKRNYLPGGQGGIYVRELRIIE